MALYDGFFDAVLDESTGKYDREYSGEDFVGYFENIVGSGVCVYENPDSFRPLWTAQGVLLAPGALFIRGYYLHNRPGPHEDPAEYRGYLVPLEGEGEQAVLAHLDLAVRRIELLCQPRGQDIPEDSLVLCYADPASGTVADTRQDPDLCGILDAAGDLSGKVAYAVDYIDNQVEGRLQEAREQIAAKEAELDGKIAQVAAEVEKITPPPVGTVQFTASQNVGPEWLLCDGSFVNEADYPELVAALGKLSPGVEAFQEILGEESGQQISNACLWQGALWVYLLQSKTLVGISASGRKEIPVTGVESLVQLAAVDTVLSVCGGGVYLAQNNQSAGSFVLLEHVGFTGQESTLPMIKLNTSTFTSGLDMEDCVPSVTETAGKMRMALGTKPDNTSGARILCFVEWTPGGFSQAVQGSCYLAALKYVGSGTAYGSYDNGRAAMALFAFSRKNANELLLLQDSAMFVSTQISLYQAVGSMVQGIFGELNQAAMTQNAAFNSWSLTTAQQEDPYYQELFNTNNPDPPRNIIPVAGGGEYLYRAEISGRKLKYVAGKYSPRTIYEYKSAGVTLPTRARLFKESVCYAQAQGIWFVFVGTGLLFTDSLAGENWGYLDTQDRLGVITLFGCLQYDLEANRLYLSGMDTAGIPKAARLQLPPLYNYANDGAWLPMLASDGVPAYIKATETEAAP